MAALIYRMGFSRFCRNLIKQGHRSLYSAASLGFDGYLSKREKIEVQFREIDGKFRTRMKEYVESPQNLVYTEDLKTMTHLISQNSEDDIKLFTDMLKKFNVQNKQMRFGTFVFGPVIMRMFYYLKKPEVALEILKDIELQPLFDQFSSYLILMDSFYKMGKYENVLEVFELLQDRQFGTLYPKDCVVLVIAACYKMNTKESFDFVIKLLEGAQDAGSIILRRGITLAAALALNQNNAAMALEILSLTRQFNYVTVKNLRLMALADLGRLDDVFITLDQTYENDVPELKEQKTQLFNDCLEKLKNAVEKSGNKEYQTKLLRFEKSLRDAKKINDTSIDVLLCSEITPREDIPFMKNRKMEPRRPFIEHPRENFRRNRKGLYDVDE